MCVGGERGVTSSPSPSQGVLLTALGRCHAGQGLGQALRGLRVRGSETTHWIPATVPGSLNLSVLICKMGVTLFAKQRCYKD